MTIGTVEHALIVGAILVAASVAALAWRNRPAPGARSLAVFMCSFVVWNLAHVTSHVLPDGLEALFLRGQWFGIAPSAFLWLAFSVAFVRRTPRLSRRTWAVLLAWPTALVAWIWLPPIAETVGVTGLPAVYPGVADESGPVYWGHVGLSYLAVLAGTVLLGRFVYRTRAIFRRQGLAVLAGIATVWVGSLVSMLQVFGQAHFLALPLGFVLSGGLCLWAITGAELTDLTPVATSTVLERMDGGVLVADREGRLVKTNPMAADLFDLSTDPPPIGEPIESVVDADLPGVGTSAEADGGDAELVPVDDRVVRVQTSWLTDDRETSIGRVFLCNDVTEHRRRQAELERKNDRLDAFASVVSHDLRNPLAVANTNLQLARETGERDRLDDAEAALERMDRLVDDLLALAREGETVEDTSPVNLASATRTNWSHVEIREAALAVETDLTIRADRSQLARLLENLFRNAVEHGSMGDQTSADAVERATPGKRDGDDSAVTVTVTVGTLEDVEDPPAAGFFVADDGSGIDPGDREVAFEAGYSSGGGSGLGLAIVERVAEAHGWTPRLTEAEDGGARFEFHGVEVVPDEATSADESVPGDGPSGERSAGADRESPDATGTSNADADLEPSDATDGLDG